MINNRGPPRIYSPLLKTTKGSAKLVRAPLAGETGLLGRSLGLFLLLERGTARALTAIAVVRETVVRIDGELYLGTLGLHERGLLDRGPADSEGRDRQDGDPQPGK